MTDGARRLAWTVLARNLKVRRGENVLIESWPHSLEYARAFVEETRRIGARPLVLYEDEEAWWDAVGSGRTSGFGTLSKVERAALEAADAYIYFWGPNDRPRRDGLPEKVQARLTGYNPEWYRRAKKAGVRGCRMTIGQATDPAARQLGLDGPTWRRRMVEAGTVDGPRLRAKGARVAKAIERGEELRIRHPNGTDLRLRLAGAHARVESGILDEAARERPFGILTNNPSGQVMVGLDAADARGVIVSNRTVYPGPYRFGGIRWVFEDGRLTESRVGLGGKLFRTMFGRAGKDRDRLGYVSIGLNPAAKDLPPVEDTEEGAALIGIGGNGFAGGKIRIPFQGFAIVGGPTVTVDGRTIASNGRVR